MLRIFWARNNRCSRYQASGRSAFVPGVVDWLASIIIEEWRGSSPLLCRLQLNTSGPYPSPSPLLLLLSPFVFSSAKNELAWRGGLGI